MPAWAGGPIVADAIKKHELKVDKIIEVHGRRGASAGTMDDFEIALKMREQYLNRKASNGSVLSSSEGFFPILQATCQIVSETTWQNRTRYFLAMTIAAA